MLEQAYYVSGVIAAVAVIASLLFVGFQVRNSSEQARLANWNSVLSGLREHKRRTDNPHVANIIVRGRTKFESLTEEEKLSFGFWMEEMVQCYDGLIVHQNSIAVGALQARRAAVGAFAFHFSYPGCLAWYHWSGIEKRWPEKLIEAIEEGILLAKSGQ